MAAPDPAVAAVRSAVRSAVGQWLPRSGGLALVACSGGADSLALAAAAAFLAPRSGWRAGLVTVDHGLQPGSDERAEAVAAWGKNAGLEPVEVATVRVAGRPGGPEAAARSARYEALVQAAARHGAAAVLLGHTRDDQAETVLLAVVRGAGLAGLAGMPATRAVDGVALVRPLLDISRAQTRQACVALGLHAWDDPHNDDPSFTRVRARALLRALVDQLGLAVVPNLARTATLAARDGDVLDRLAEAAWQAAADDTGDTTALRIADLAGLAPAVRTRVLHTWARRLGVPGAALSYRHVTALDALVTRWRGQGPVHLPGAVIVARQDGLLRRT